MRLTLTLPITSPDGIPMYQREHELDVEYEGNGARTHVGRVRLIQGTKRRELRLWWMEMPYAPYTYICDAANEHYRQHCASMRDETRDDR